MPEARTLYIERALLADGWARQLVLSIDEEGLITGLKPDVASMPAGAEAVSGVVVPGMANCHSHAFQRAMAGLTETRGSGDDSFWSWRDAMYRLLQHIGPDELQAISEQLYIEMLKHGYTAVGEFHYLHHNPSGVAYDDPTEMSRRVIGAAQSVGIHITHLPVLYCHSDFGGLPPETGQRRFVHDIDAYQNLLQQLHKAYQGVANVQLGIAPHSLRAVSEPLLRQAIAAIDELDGAAPIHIHIAEQEREVVACLEHTGKRPVAWLLDHFDLDARWCLVHATHVDEQETLALADSAAIAGLCPTTEANLGDGIFPAVDYLQGRGRFAIGSDSQVCLDPAQELRLLEYGQRLQRRRRSLLADAQQPSVGEYLFRGAARGGAQALGLNSGELRQGARADLLVLDQQHPGLYSKQESALLDSWIFSCNGTPVKDVMVAGQWRVRDGVHAQEEAVAQRFREVLDRLGQRH
ncbi:MAG: formimidoylglutamate deiminase [Halieaceae bacterium]